MNGKCFSTIIFQRLLVNNWTIIGFTNFSHDYHHFLLLISFSDEFGKMKMSDGFTPHHYSYNLGDF